MYRTRIRTRGVAGCVGVRYAWDSAGDGSLAKMLNLPGRIGAEDGSRDQFEVVFREIDKDGSRTIDFGEFYEYFRGLTKVSGFCFISGGG